MESQSGYFRLVEAGTGYTRNMETWVLEIKDEVTGRWLTVPMKLYYDDLVDLRDLLDTNTVA
jgi:hypothetical protein